MPMISVTLPGPPDPARSRRVAALLSGLTRDHLGKDPAVTAVAVSHVDPDHWFVAGPSLAEQGRAAFWLDVTVTAGTNTKLELAAYQRAVFAELGGILGDVHPESYVLVHEVPAAAYGYGGVTQEVRFVAARLGASGDAFGPV